MKPAHHLLFFERSPWNRPWCWCVLTVLALTIHYFLGDWILFPLVGLIPVMLAAWHAGPRFAIGLAVVIALTRWIFCFVWTPPWSLLEAGVNALVRGLMLVLVALLTAWLSRALHLLRQRVSTLERLLPICAFCKRIRDERGEWKPLELYIASRTDTQFSHGFCPECARKNYPEIFPPQPQPQPAALL